MTLMNRLPKKRVEEFIQEELRIEDYYLYIPQEKPKEKEEEIERGVIIIDLM